mmetsp:Transcript_20791/g.31308  ORF Transcript_20791/g.31308 Transcript_20791/m.31308 type:complete len:965 (+) Transcript_20791:157-3051(+)
MQLKCFNFVFGLLLLLPFGECKIGGWKQCLQSSLEKFGAPGKLCSPKEICVDGECFCPEGTKNDGGRGCIDIDECISADYPCPGTPGVQSFCVDRDYDDSYYKCGCLPGYRPIYSNDDDHSATKVPIEFRPRECAETFLIKRIKLDLMISIPPTIEITEMIEEYKARKNAMIHRLIVRVNTNLALTAKVNAIDVIATPTECHPLSDKLDCFLLKIETTYLAVVTETREDIKKILDYKEILENYKSKTDGFSKIDEKLNELSNNAEQVAFDSTSLALTKFIGKNDRNSNADIAFVSPITTPPTTYIDSSTSSLERTQPNPGGEDCIEDSECQSGLCRDLDSKCDDDRIAYDIFLNFTDDNLNDLRDLIDTQVVNITDALVNIITEIECARLEGKICLDQLIDGVNFLGSYEPLSGFFNDNLALERLITLDDCEIGSRFSRDKKSSTISFPELNQNFNLTNEPTLSPTRSPSQFIYILFFQIISRCYGCTKGNFFLTPDGSRRNMKERELLSVKELLNIDFCEAADQKPILPAVANKTDFERSLKAELEPEVAALFVEASEEQDWTLEPSNAPSIGPSCIPSVFPSLTPSKTPSAVPSTTPSSNPSKIPSSLPSPYPSTSPTTSPTIAATTGNFLPSQLPSSSRVPSDTPSKVPSNSHMPTDVPSGEPSSSLLPSETPSNLPSNSQVPSETPSNMPSSSNVPSDLPSQLPSKVPSKSQFPSERPSEVPSLSVSPSVDTVEIFGIQYSIQNTEFIDLSNSGLLGLLTGLTFLTLGSLGDNSGAMNDLSGTIPTEIGSLTNLSGLSLRENTQLSGSIPSEIGLLTNLSFLDFYSNELAGAIPTNIGLLTGLKDLYLSQNSFTVGTIPTELGLLTALTYLEVFSSSLTRMIPSEIGLLTSINSILLNDNSLSGTIPTQIASLINLTFLTLDGNVKVRGEIPASLCSNFPTPVIVVDNVVTCPGGCCVGV